MTLIHRQTLPERARGMAADALEEALGHEQRQDPVAPGTGGPAGNARLTAWTGLVLLVLFVAELLTLFDVRGLISWHLVIGVLLVPPALLKTASTGWRIARYYLGTASYREAGPPVMLLRLLGPLVVGSTLAVLGSGLVLVLIGPDTSRSTLLTVLGQRIDAVTVHQVMFAAWGVTTGLHLLARLIPALRLTVIPAAASTRVPGTARRTVTIMLTVAVAVLSAALVLSAAGDWRAQQERHSGPPPPGFSRH